MQVKDPYYPNIMQSLGLTLAWVVFSGFIGAILVAACITMPEAYRPALGWVLLPAYLLSLIGLLVWAKARSGLALRELCYLQPFRASTLLPTVLVLAGLVILGSELDNILRERFPLPPPPTPKGGEAEAALRLPDSALAYTLAAVVLTLGQLLLLPGVILRGLRQWVPDRLAILKCGALMMVMTMLMVSPRAAPMALLTGLFLSWLVVRGGSLWPALVAQGLVILSSHLLAGLSALHLTGFSTPAPGATVVEHQPVWFNTVGLLLMLAGGAWLRLLYPPLPPEPKPATQPDDASDDDDF